MKDKLKTLFLSSWTPAEKTLLLADVLLFGVLLGWLTSPLRDGINLFSHNSWDFSKNDTDWEEWDLEESEE